MKTLLILVLFLPACKNLTLAEREALLRFSLSAGERVLDKATK